MTMIATRVVHCKKDSFDVYIGRSQNTVRGRWGNPFSHLPTSIAKHHVPHDQVLIEYEKWIRTQLSLMHDLVPMLRGKVLGCWCKPKACHGDVLARLADACTCKKQYIACHQRICEPTSGRCESHLNCRCGCPRYAHIGFTDRCFCGCMNYSPLTAET